MVELITVQTSDGCYLDAAYWPAAGGSGRADACVFTHGATGNAFGPLQRRFGEALSGAGVATLSINSRGHDVVSNATRASGPMRAGTAFEDLDDAPKDIHAGIECLIGRGHQRIAVAGHSLGAVKSIFTQAAEPHAAVTALIALSPPRLAFEVQSSFGQEFLDILARAQALVEAGRPNELLNARLPIPSYFGAAQYVKKYGHDSRYDIAAHLPHVTVPTFALFGEIECATMPQIRASAAAVTAIAANRPAIAVCHIPGADHVYTGCIAAATTALSEWMAES